MVSGLNLNTDNNEIMRLLAQANAQGFEQAFPGGTIDIDKLPQALRDKIEQQRDVFLAEGGDADQSDSEAEIKKFSELLGQELRNVPGAPPGFDPQLLIDWIM